MVLLCVKLFLSVILAFQTIIVCNGQFIPKRNIQMVSPVLPFPTCRADNIDCLRRGLRTFFLYMDASSFGMKPVDPAIINSVALAFSEQQMSFLLRRVNVTGANWTKLVARRFNLEGNRSGVIFNNDFHVTGEIIMESAGRSINQNAFITMDIQSIESNITYPWRLQRGFDNEDYILIGLERVAVRNIRTPTYFLQPNNEYSATIDQVLQTMPSILEHFSNELTTALMHSIVDNFRTFASTVPMRHYYQYFVDEAETEGQGQ